MNDLNYYIELLANKIEAYAKPKNTIRGIDQAINAAELKHNLSSVTYAILKFLFKPAVDTSAIEAVISAYNDENGTDLSLTYFMEEGFLRHVNGKYFYPSIVGEILFDMNNPMGRPPRIRLEEHEQAMQCMANIAELLQENYERSITEDELETLIRENYSTITIDQLQGLSILSRQTDGQIRYTFQWWHDYDFSDRVIARAWNDIVGEDVSFEKLQVFFQFLQFSDCWPEHLENFIPYEQVKKIVDHAEDRLWNEPDLQFPENEVRNAKYDGPRYHRHFDTLPKIPVYHFTEQSPYPFLIQLRNYRFYDHELFTFLENGAIYRVFIRLLAQYDRETEHYPRIFRIIKEHPNPYIRVQVLSHVLSDRPGMIAHYLSDTELAPLTFHYLDEISISNDWVMTAFGGDHTFEMSGKIREDLWNETFDIYLDAIKRSFNAEAFAEPVAMILHQLTTRTFRFNSTNAHRSTDQHELYRERYEGVIKKLTEARLQMSSYHYNGQLPLMIGKLLPGIYQALSTLPEWLPVNDLLHFDTAWIDLRMEMLNFLELDMSDKDLYHREDGLLEKLPDLIRQDICEYFVSYFTLEELKVYDFRDDPQAKPAKRHGDFGVEIIGWKVFFNALLRFGELEKFDRKIIGSVILNPQLTRYDHENTQSLFKATLYLKVLLHTYLGIKNTDSFSSSDTNSIEAELVLLIRKHALRFSKDDLLQDRIDVFSSDNFIYNEGPYFMTMTSRLFYVLNKFPAIEQMAFVEEFFGNDTSYDKLLRAYNRIDAVTVRKVIEDKILSADHLSFIEKTSYSMIQSVLAEIANSRTLFHLAGPFVEVLDKFANREQMVRVELKDFLFRIKMLLALKNGNEEELKSMQPPELPYHGRRSDHSDLEEKDFYLALLHSEQPDGYEDSLEALLGLTQKHPLDVRFGFYLYQIQTFHEKDAQLNFAAKARWDKLKTDLPEKDKQELSSYLDQSKGLDLLYYIKARDWELMDQVVNTLAASFLYQDHLVRKVCEAYLERGMAEFAFIFLKKATRYFNENGMVIPAYFEEIEDRCMDDKNIARLASLFTEIAGLSPGKVPRVVPEKLNGQQKLPEFILRELINGLQVMREKIVALGRIGLENHYNDILVSMLRLRVPIWGWEITDQSRSGVAPGGSDAGELDITVVAGGKTLALIEALRLTGGNFPYLEEHILKVANYNRDLRSFVVITYYIGNRTGWANFLTTYETDVKRVNYPAGRAMDMITGFVRIDKKFGEPNNMLLAKTIHGSDQQLIYHLIVDFSIA